MPDVAPQVTHDPATGRFEIHTEQGTALLAYRQRGVDLDLVHTEVPQALEGRGYAAALATSALDYARREGMRIIPTCPYVKAFIDRHPAYADLVVQR